MAIRGSLREAGLPDVLQLLSLGQKTGCLSVAQESSFGSIYFDRGRIAYALIVNRRDRLGEMLVRSRAITRETLDHALGEQLMAGTGRLGDILVSSGALTRDVLQTHVRMQIEEAVYSLFTWTHGTFSFEAGVEPEEQDYVVSINPESLLLEGARRVDEWSLIEKKISSFDLVFSLDAARLAESGVALTPEQERLAPLVDGERDLAALVDKSALGEFEVAKAMFGLVSAGFAKHVGKSRPGLDRLPDARINEHRNLGVAFYKTAMFDEAAREFRRVLDLGSNDPSARFYLGLVALRQGRYREAADALREAAALPGALPAVLHNLAVALECSGRLDEAATAYEDALARGGANDPRIRTGQGSLVLRRGDAAGADALLAAARPLWGKRTPSAVWFHYAALAAALTGDTARAVSLLEEGVAAHPHAAPLLNNLAAATERRGQFESATRWADQAVAEEPTLPQAQKNMGDAHYRAGRYDEAHEALQRAVKLRPDAGADAYLKLGNIRMRRGERTEGIALWERALELQPTNAIVRANLEAVRRAAQPRAPEPVATRAAVLAGAG
jgi:tetratricopeptide (TPR) repeat protein